MPSIIAFHDLVILASKLLTFCSPSCTNLQVANYSIPKKNIFHITFALKLKKEKEKKISKKNLRKKEVKNFYFALITCSCFKQIHKSKGEIKEN